MHNNTAIDRLIKAFSKLPGLGQKSAKRAVLHLLQNKESSLEPLLHYLEEASEQVQSCLVCGNLDTQNPCFVCQDNKRDNTTLCVIEQVVDLWAMERTMAFRGRYHILGGNLSALDGIRPEDLKINTLLNRLNQGDITEVIIALKASVDGQTTAHYLADKINHGFPQITITRLAHGMPLGGELDYMDDGTITTALKARQAL